MSPENTCSIPASKKFVFLLTGLLLLCLVGGMLVAEKIVRVKVGASRDAGWRFSGAVDEKNQLGFRGRKIAYDDSDKVVLLVGDSQVEAASWPFDQMPERRLEKHLSEQSPGEKIKVFSIGSGGYGQDQQLLALEEYFKHYRADWVVVWVTPHNDVWNNVFPTHGRGCEEGVSKPTFWIEGGLLRGPHRKMGRPKYMLLDWLFVEGSEKEWEKKKLAAYPAYRPALEKQASSGMLGLAKFEFWNVEAQNFESEKTSFNIALVPRSPRTQYGIDLTNALLRKIKSLVDGRGGRTACFSANTVEPFENGWLEKGDKYYRVERAQVEESIRDLVRGLDYFGDYKPGMKDWMTSESDRHLNAKANDEVMGQVARDLKKGFLQNRHQTTWKQKIFFKTYAV